MILLAPVTLLLGQQQQLPASRSVACQLQQQQQAGGQQMGFKQGTLAQPALPDGYHQTLLLLPAGVGPILWQQRQQWRRLAASLGRGLAAVVLLPAGHQRRQQWQQHYSQGSTPSTTTAAAGQ
jgi:hypothetical protein